MNYKFNDIASFFKDTRKKLGYSQDQMAKLLEIDRAYLSRIENDKAEPSLRLIKIAEAILQSELPDNNEDSGSTVKESPAPYNEQLEAERAEVPKMVHQLFDRLEELKQLEGETGKASRIEDILLAFKPFLEMEDEDPDIAPYIRTVLKTHVPPDILEKMNLK